MKSIKLVIIIGFTILIAACSKTPMQWLKSDNQAEHLNNGFWAKEFEGKTPLWQEAMTYCQAHQEKINCGPVNETLMLLNNNTEMPAPGSGHEIQEPKY